MKPSREQTPHKHATKRNLARVEAVELMDDILKLLLKGHTLDIVYRMCIEQKQISQYCFKTFQKAVKEVLKAKGYTLHRNALPMEVIVAAKGGQESQPLVPAAGNSTPGTANTILPAAKDDYGIPRGVKING
ncbi:MAG: hypothetical protein ACLGSA_11275 [Acidobacteriota bacterium]